MDPFKSEAIELAIKKLFHQSHFSICAVKDVAELLGNNCEAHAEYKELQVLHCVKYRDMSAEMKAELKGKVMRVMTSNTEAKPKNLKLLTLSK